MEENLTGSEIKSSNQKTPRSQIKFQNIYEKYSNVKKGLFPEKYKAKKKKR
jgi:hypothetical protein